GRVDRFAALILDVTPEVTVADLERKQREIERRATARLESLLVVTAKLARAARREDAERVPVAASTGALGAASAALWPLSPDRQELVLVRERGMRAELAADYKRLPMTLRGPVTDCVRTGRPVFAPPVADDDPHRLCALPIVIEGTVTGCL